eukprot:TRINITY_DN12561_c0_g1_i3.p1 TRINITY_DN12561_c0_g1~~TRINITY_DN12561_c0_g1_i3.p1  ORF type:complete len:389 (+),score=49.61 TRINITY_DN12561_c0_g1_i3:71-1237(+)
MGGPTDKRDEYHKLVEEVKQKQRKQDGFQEAWRTYCATNGGGRMDPYHHDADFLIEALAKIKAGDIFKNPMMDRPIDNQTHEDLMGIVKYNQRNLPGWSEAWWHYCSVHSKGGKKDPKLLDEEFLRNALRTLKATPEELERLDLQDNIKRRQREWKGYREYWSEFCHSNGVRTMDPAKHNVEFLRRALIPPDENHLELVGIIKEHQRRSPQFKEDWSRYCQACGCGVRDPYRHGPEFLTVAIRQLIDGRGLRGVPAKHRFGNHNHVSYDRKRAKLAETIKRLQKTTPELRQKWLTHCENYGSSNFDPLLHDTQFLEDALAYMQGRRSQRANSEQEELVSLIKRGQRNCEQWKARWWAYTDNYGDGNHDPSRHEVSFLKKAIKDIGQPP